MPQKLASHDPSLEASRARPAKASPPRAAAEGGGGENLLHRLLAARDPDSGAPMDDERLVNNLLTLLEAGHETTSRALTWTLYLLARAPDWQDRLRAEVRAAASAGP